MCERSGECLWWQRFFRVGELIANLARLGIPAMQASYRLQWPLPLTTQLQVLNDAEAVPDDCPVLGSNAYRLTCGASASIRGERWTCPPEMKGHNCIVSDLMPDTEEALTPP